LPAAAGAAGVAETVADAAATDCIDWGAGAALGAGAGAGAGTDWGAGAALGTRATGVEEAAEADPAVEPEATFFSAWIAPARPITPLNAPAGLDALTPAALAASFGAVGAAGAAAAAPAVIAPAADAPNGVAAGFVPDGGAVTTPCSAFRTSPDTRVGICANPACCIATALGPTCRSDACAGGSGG